MALTPSPLPNAVPRGFVPRKLNHYARVTHDMGATADVRQAMVALIQRMKKQRYEREI